VKPDEPQQRPLPTSTVQVAGQAASDVIGGLKQQPMLLALVLLNVIAVAAALWFLRDLHERQRSNVELVVKSFEKENAANRDLVNQCFVIAREIQQDLRSLRDRRGDVHDPNLPPPPG
jgi:hypothetical protein